MKSLGDESQFLEMLKQNSFVDLILERSEKLDIQNWAVGAGFLQQSIFNIFHQKPVLSGIKDIDWVYYDRGDLTEEGEAQVIQLVQDIMSDIPLRFDIKNQARVHLWYRRKFGYDIQPYSSLEDAIGTWPTTSTAVALTRRKGQIEIIAPFGLQDLMEMTIRPNKRQITEDIYNAKLDRWKTHWPQLRIIPW